ncbi:hypothetical protein EB47_00001, partial [Enterococcus faecium]
SLGALYQAYFLGEYRNSRAFISSLYGFVLPVSHINVPTTSIAVKGHDKM